MNYYNDNDPKVAAWLKQLSAKRLIGEGHVDDRSIRDVRAAELREFDQCHFFAGIGGWPYALRLAGWPDTLPVWTGSCPCQPLSCAGKRKGEMDERHLWPEFYRLIAECRPATIFGEQVASNDGLEWLDGVSLDLEELDYAFAAADLPGACAGAPQQRQRLFWVAHAGCERICRSRPATTTGTTCGVQGEDEERQRFRPDSGASGTASIARLAHSNVTSEHGRAPSGQQPLCDQRHGSNEAVGHAAVPGPQGEWREYRPRGKGSGGLVGFAMQASVPQWNGPTIAVKCSDGTRRVSAEPGSFPLANGIPARMVRLRAYGNAIIPQVAAKFVQAFMSTITG